jgi:hypothetical protein
MVFDQDTKIYIHMYTWYMSTVGVVYLGWYMYMYTAVQYVHVYHTYYIYVLM